MEFEKLTISERRKVSEQVHSNQSVDRRVVRLRRGDARDLSWIPDQSVHLIVTSPPYWTLKQYNPTEGQLGHIETYSEFHEELNKVWAHCFRVLVPGGRLVCVVGDVCLARKKFGRHLVVPLHADIQVNCSNMGFDNLNPIFWYKISNVVTESGGGRFLGKPYEPNAIIKNDVEYILSLRKPGGYRKPTTEQRMKSMIAKSEFSSWFQQIWQLPGASTKEHPAPFPVEIANRLVRMFSFHGDIILDPFCGTGTTMIAALNAGRHAFGSEIDAEYHKIAMKRILALGARDNALDIHTD